MSKPSTRIRAFDWLRGLAVLVMIECHALVFLHPELRGGPWGPRLDFANGLVAPSFIFASGFSLALVQVRAALSATAGTSRRGRVLRSFRRASEVLAVGLLINFIWFHQLVWLLRLDILPSIGVSLMLLLPVLAALAPRPRLLIPLLVVIAGALFGLAPIGEQVAGPWANALNRHGSLQPVFPLLPWTGYVFLGAAFGALVASAPARLTGVLWGLFGFALALRFAAPVFERVYPPHSLVNDPSNHGERLVMVALMLLALRFLETRWGEGFRRVPPMRVVELFGTTSLAAYFFHQMILFLHVGHHSLKDHFENQAGWGFFGLLLVGVWAVTWALVWLTDRLYPRYDAWVSRYGV
jgi:uncharacterized membrane protein